MNKLIHTLLIFSFFSAYVQGQDTDKMSIEELDSLVGILMDEGNFASAIPFAQKSVEKAKNVHDTILASSMDNLAVLYFYTGAYDDCEQLFEKAKDLKLKYFGKNSLPYSKSLNSLAIIHMSLEEYEKAEPLFLESLRITEILDEIENEGYAKSLNNLAELYRRMGEYEKAEPLCLQTKQLWEKINGKKHPNYAQSLNNLALIYQGMERHEQAEPLLLESAEIRGEILGKEHIFYAQSLNNLAGLYYDTKQLEKAERYYQQSLEIKKKTLGSNSPDYADGLGNLASVYNDMKEFAKAEKLYAESAAIIIKAFGSQHSKYTIILLNTAIMYFRSGQYEKAEKLYKESIKIKEQSFGEQNTSSLKEITGLAEVYQKWGKYPECIATLNTALKNNIKSTEKNIAANPFDEKFITSNDFFSLYELGYTYTIFYRLYKAEYDKNKQPQYLDSAYLAITANIQAAERMRNDFSNQNDKKEMLSVMNKLLENAMEIGLLKQQQQVNEEMFFFAEMNKSMLLADATKQQRAHALGDAPDSLVLQELQLQSDFDFLQKQAAQAASPEDKAQINAEIAEINIEINNLKNTLEQQFPKYYKLKYANITAKAKDIQTLLPAETVFLEYFIADSLVYVFSISKDKVLLLPINIKQKDLLAQINLLRTALTDYKQIKNETEKNYQIYTQSAFWFFNTLVKPALVSSSNIKNLIIIADGELGHLPFEAFLSEAAPQQGDYSSLHYLCRDYTISYNYSATLWKENLQNPKKQNNGQLFAFASSYTPADSTRVNENTRSPHLRTLRDALTDLPAAKSEVEALAAQFSGDFRFGTDANEAYFKANAAQYGIIHLAMHGILNQRAPILSSLAFSENRDSIEDNFLEAWEISHLNLNADLVVLSACETGYGKFQQGEGVISLARSFMYAGVPALVMSMWEVNDASTSKIMQAFYKNLHAGQDKAEALRQAKLEYLSSASGISAHPAYWSPFVQLGDSRPVSLAAPKSNRLWFWALGGVGILALGFFILRTRRRR